MSNQFLGEIRITGHNFPIRGWAFCDGQLLAIAQNDALYALLGTTYGGDGVTTFGLPDLRGRSPLHQGQGPGLPNYIIGQKSGVETVTLTTSQIPSHTHTVGAVSVAAGAVTTPSGNLWCANSNTGSPQFAPGSTTPKVSMAGMVSANGGSQPHENMAPFSTLSFIIALEGIFPPQN